MRTVGGGSALPKITRSASHLIRPVGRDPVPTFEALWRNGGYLGQAVIRRIYLRTAGGQVALALAVRLYKGPSRSTRAQAFADSVHHSLPWIAARRTLNAVSRQPDHGARKSLIKLDF